VGKKSGFVGVNPLEDLFDADNDLESESGENMDTTENKITDNKAIS
jgi:hypothetical protein